MSRDDTGRETTTRQPEQAQQSEAEERDWADEAAQARTADDPRATAPHDRTGRPSTGNP